MTDEKDTPEGFQPAPWEATKPKTQGPNPYPPQPGAHQPPPPPPRPPAPPQPGGNYLSSPGAGVPLGGRPAQSPPPSLGGEMGRARTRQIPNQPQPETPQGYPPQTPAAPQGYPAQAPAAPQGYQQPPSGTPQGYGAPPPQGPMPQGPGYPPGPGAQPYQGGMQAMPAGKPTSTFGIISLVLIGVGALAGLVSLGTFSVPMFLVGAILGYLGIRETQPWGKKAGRKLAIAGTIANVACLVLNGAALIGFAMLVSKGVDYAKAQQAALTDGGTIQKRIYKYAKAKGDIQPGGPQMRLGFENSTAVEGPQLKVTDLVSETEITNPIDQYRLVINGETATVMWRNPSGHELQVGAYTPGGDSFGNWNSNKYKSNSPYGR